MGNFRWRETGNWEGNLAVGLCKTQADMKRVIQLDWSFDTLRLIYYTVLNSDGPSVYASTATTTVFLN